jgi:hypothetical protein
MNLQHRIDLLADLGKYIKSGDAGWEEAKLKASAENRWFILPFIDIAVNQIAEEFLDRNKLMDWVNRYGLQAEKQNPKNIGLVMAGNIPLVGFHDFLCVFLSGHKQTIKLSSRDNVLLKHLAEVLYNRNSRVRELVFFADMLRGCDAYIATGSNNSARYFEYYFDKYPHIIRRNRTSVGILDGDESAEDLGKLADDVFLYFGLGCRNITKIYIPRDYDFIPLLNALNKYSYLADNNKYKNNYDYQLALFILNKQYYMTNNTILLSENSASFSPIAVLNYEYYPDADTVLRELKGNNEIQCVVGRGNIPFGKAQQPGLGDYADGVDTLQFLLEN